MVPTICKFDFYTSCGYVKVEANILEIDEAMATSRALSLSIVVFSEKTT